MEIFFKVSASIWEWIRILKRRESSEQKRLKFVMIRASMIN